MRKSNVDEKIVLDLYYKGLTDAEISRVTGYKDYQVYWVRHKKHKLPNNYENLLEKNKTQIIELCKQRVPIKRISKIVNIKIPKIRKFLRECGFKDLRHITKEKNIGKREISILTGILMGDGTIEKKRKEVTRYDIYARFCVRHGPKQKLYNLYVFDCLRSIKPRINTVYVKCHELNNKVIKPQYQTEVITKKMKFFSLMYNTFYIDNKKIIPFNWLRKYYNAEALAFHFMDDGSKCCDKRGKINGFVLCTNCFTQEECLRFIDFLNGRFGLNMDLCKYKDNQYGIRIKTDSVTRFISIVKPYIPDSMLYKISPSKTPLNGESPVEDNPVLNLQEIEENA